MPHEKRSAQEQRSVVSYLKQLQFFKKNKIKDRNVQEMSYGFKFFEERPGVPLSRFGQKGDTFIIFLSGHCSAWIPLPDKKSAEVATQFCQRLQNAEKMPSALSFAM